MYGTRYSDIHCGMRAMTLEALKRIDLQSQSWEYASEMVLKAGRLRLKMSEVPIHFYKDRPGRLSHLKRSGWFSPWQAGWINLRVMFLYAPDFFLFRPGAVMLALGLFLTVLLVSGPTKLGPVILSLNSMLLGVTLSAIGYMAVWLGLLARVYHDFNPRYTQQVLRGWSYNRGMVLAGALSAVGVIAETWLLITWLKSHLQLTAISFPGVLGLLMIILGFETFAFTLILHMIAGTQPHVQK